MEFKFQIEDQKDYLLVMPEGDIPTIEELCIATRQLLLEAAELKRPRILITRSREQFSMDAMEAIAFANFLDEQDLQKHGIRTAILFDQNNRQRLQVLETTLRNRAFSYKSFCDQTQAVQWLTGN